MTDPGCPVVCEWRKSCAVPYSAPKAAFLCLRVLTVEVTVAECRGFLASARCRVGLSEIAPVFTHDRVAGFISVLPVFSPVPKRCPTGGVFHSGVEKDKGRKIAEK